jgi:DmsE family decaheme c-type cytochrome
MTSASLVIAALVMILSLVLVARASAGNPAAPPDTAAAQASSGACRRVHLSQLSRQSEYKGPCRPRRRREHAGGHAWLRSCHGPGQAHVESGDTSKIVNPSKLSAQEASETCTACHNRATHALWSGSQHDQRNVGCVTCHSVHEPKGDGQIKAVSQLQLCSTCHRNVTNKQFRFNHMPVREGKVECSSCHNMHGSANVKLLKVGTTVDDSCTSCHSDKRGPHLWSTRRCPTRA